MRKELVMTEGKNEVEGQVAAVDKRDGAMLLSFRRRRGVMGWVRVRKLGAGSNPAPESGLDALGERGVGDGRAAERKLGAPLLLWPSSR